MTYYPFLDVMEADLDKAREILESDVYGPCNDVRTNIDSMSDVCTKIIDENEKGVVESLMKKRRKLYNKFCGKIAETEKQLIEAITIFDKIVKMDDACKHILFPILAKYTDVDRMEDVHECEPIDESDDDYYDEDMEEEEESDNEDEEEEDMEEDESD